MTSLLLAPHNDDETLFASFLCLRERPHVIVVLRSQVQEDRFGITAATRETETFHAMLNLGCTWEQWPYPDARPDWELIEASLVNRRELEPTDRVYAPAREPQGGKHTPRPNSRPRRPGVRPTIRKLMIVPWFGPLPEWMPYYRSNIERLAEHGYDFLFDHDLPRFCRRVYDTIGVTFPGHAGGSKVHDYRAAFGAMYATEVKGYDFWGHTDLDCVYGRVERYATDELLESCDLHTDGNDYVNGPWSLYRASYDVLPYAFGFHDDWREILEDPVTHGWVETSFTDLVRGILGDRMVVTSFQHRALDDFGGAFLSDDGRLTEDGDERMLAHFRRTKVYPYACR